MTVQTSESTAIAAPSRHGHGSTAEDGGAHASHDAGTHEAVAGNGALGAVVALPRNVKIVGGAVVGFGALLAVGVPLATLTPLVFLGGCLGMHLFMGHGMSHGGGHGSHDSSGVASGSAEDASTRTGAHDA
jgi:hypothetical protein